MEGEQNFPYEALKVGLAPSQTLKILATFSECHPCLEWWLPQPCPPRTGLFRRICPSISLSCLAQI